MKLEITRHRIAIISTHPVQYNAPLFKMISQTGDVTIKVFYTWGDTVLERKYDPGFEKEIEWDIPLLEGYDYVFVKNTAKKKGSHHFNGIINPGLVKMLAEWKPTAILVFGWGFKSHFAVMRTFKGKVPILFRGDSTLLDEKPGIKRIFRRWFLRWVYRYVDVALYTGTNNRNYFLAHGLKLQQLTYAPHAVDNSRFRDLHNGFEHEAAALRNQLGYHDEDIVLLFAGKFEPKKNPFFLLKILQRIKDSRLKLLFAGGGVLEKELKEAASDKRIKFLGFQNQRAMPVIYRVADLFILPSAGPGETWGLALNEAMACGKPVIASDKVGGAIDLIKQGENGIIIRENDTAGLDDLLLKLLKDKRALEIMGNKSEEIVRDFSLQQVTLSLLKTIQNIGKN